MMKNILIKILRLAILFLSVLFFPIGCFVLGWYTHRYCEEKKIRKEVRIEIPITSNAEDEKEDDEGVVV